MSILPDEDDDDDNSPLCEFSGVGNTTNGVDNDETAELKVETKSKFADDALEAINGEDEKKPLLSVLCMLMLSLLLLPKSVNPNMNTTESKEKKRFLLPLEVVSAELSIAPSLLVFSSLCLECVDIVSSSSECDVSEVESDDDVTTTAADACGAGGRLGKPRIFRYSSFSH